MTNKSILVTGGAGFIGSHLVDALLEDQYKVTVLDNFSTGKLSNLPEHENLAIIDGDVSQVSAVNDALKQPIDAVVHLAAVASVAKSVENPVSTHQSNFVATLNLLDAMRNKGIKRIVYASSAAVYGDQSTIPTSEKSQLNPLTPYAADKLQGEYYLDFYRRQFALEPVIFRFFNIYGPRQDPSSPYSGVISIFVKKASENSSLTVFGDGQQTRDFVYVADVVNLLKEAIFKDQPPFMPTNIGRGESYSLNYLIETLAKLFATELTVNYQTARAGDIRFSQACNQRLLANYHYNTQYSLEMGLQRLLKYDGYIDK